MLRGEILLCQDYYDKKMKKKCHAGHLGINSSLRLARDALFWPDMSTEVKSCVETCGVCASMLAKQPQETVISSEIRERPWQKVGSDIMSLGSHSYLLFCMIEHDDIFYLRL